MSRTDWRFIGYFCLGYPQTESDQPELERAGWEQRRGTQSLHPAALTVMKPRAAWRLPQPPALLYKGTRVAVVPSCTE